MTQRLDRQRKLFTCYLDNVCVFHKVNPCQDELEIQFDGPADPAAQRNLFSLYINDVCPCDKVDLPQDDLTIHSTHIPSLFPTKPSSPSVKATVPPPALPSAGPHSKNNDTVQLACNVWDYSYDDSNVPKVLVCPPATYNVWEYSYDDTFSSDYLEWETYNGWEYSYDDAKPCNNCSETGRSPAMMD